MKKKTIDAVALVEGIREKLVERWAKNKKLMWEDLRKVRNGTMRRPKSRRKRNNKS